MKDLFDYWISVVDWESEEAALICSSKDPRQYKRQIKFPPGDSHDYSRYKPNTWQWEVLESYYIFENAAWRKYIDEKSDPYLFWRHPKKAWYGHFLDIAVNERLKLPPALSDEWVKLNNDKTSAHHTKPEIEQESRGDENSRAASIETETLNIEDAFDALPTDTIAAIFKIKTDLNENKGWWRKKVSNAKATELENAIVTKGRGSKQATLNLYIVGEWVIQKEGWKPKSVYQILADNLPPRSAERRDDLLMIVES